MRSWRSEDREIGAAEARLRDACDQDRLVRAQGDQAAIGGARNVITERHEVGDDSMRQLEKSALTALGRAS